VLSFFTHIFDSDFMPHGMCYLWDPQIVWVNVVSDSLIALSYLTIPFSLVYFLRKRTDLPFRWMFGMFGLFIVGCGATHIMEVWTLWYGTYRLAGVIKVVTAGASVATAALLVRLMPEALSLPSAAEIRKHEAKLTGLLEAAPDSMIVTTPDGVMRLVNGQTERLFGYQRDELLGHPVEMLVPERLRQQHPAHRAHYSQDPHWRPMGAGLDLFGRRKDGTEFPVEISLSPLQTEEETLFTSAVRDISDRRRLEESIRQQNRELEAKNRLVEGVSRMKSEFLANMSHELRTPLNSIIGFAELMHDGKLGPTSDAHREYLNDMLTSARHLLRLINDVLDVSKIESGKMEFFPEPIDLGSVVRELRDQMRPQAASKRIRVDTEIDGALTGVTADASKLKQVLYNYLSNAVKYTGEGGRVVVRVQAENEHEFRIEVEDTRRRDSPRRPGSAVRGISAARCRRREGVSGYRPRARADQAARRSAGRPRRCAQHARRRQRLLGDPAAKWRRRLTPEPGPTFPPTRRRSTP
jgi:PAS domain S-box-containing protein